MILPFCHTIDSSDQTDFFDGEKYAVASFEKDVALLKFVQTFLYCQQTSIVPNFRRNWTFQIVRPQAIKLSRGLRCSGNLWESVLNCIVTVAVCVWTNQGSLVTQFGRRRLCGNVMGLSWGKLYRRRKWVIYEYRMQRTKNIIRIIWNGKEKDEHC